MFTFKLTTTTKKNPFPLSQLKSSYVAVYCSDRISQGTFQTKLLHYILKKYLKNSFIAYTFIHISLLLYIFYLLAFNIPLTL